MTLPKPRVSEQPQVSTYTNTEHNRSAAVWNNTMDPSIILRRGKYRVNGVCGTEMLVQKSQDGS